MSIRTVARWAFKASAADVAHLESIAKVLRSQGRPFTTRSDVFRTCMKLAASDPTRVIEASK